MNSILFKTKYNGTTFERQYEIEDVSTEDAAIETVRNKVVNINESITGGQMSELTNLFVSDNYDSTQSIGTLSQIYNVKIKTVIETEIPQTVAATRSINFDEDILPNFIPEIPVDNDDKR